MHPFISTCSSASKTWNERLSNWFKLWSAFLHRRRGTGGVCSGICPQNYSRMTPLHLDNYTRIIPGFLGQVKLASRVCGPGYANLVYAKHPCVVLYISMSEYGRMVWAMGEACGSCSNILAGNPHAAEVESVDTANFSARESM